MEFVVKAGGCKQIIGGVWLFLGHQGSIDATCWWMCQHWPLSPFLFCVFCCFLFFLFQENLQLAPCVELHPRIWAGQAHRKENSCQTMNYCAVTRQVPLQGVDEEAGSVSRITHSRGPSCVFVHTVECRHFLWTLWETRTKSLKSARAEALLLSGRNTGWCRKPIQHKPNKVEDKHPVFANILLCWEEEEKYLRPRPNV